MASFQSKIHCRKPRKGNNETYCSDPFLPTRLIIENSKKIAKNSKNLKIPLWCLFKSKLIGEGREREKIKIVVPFCSYPSRNRKFQKNSNKIEK